ncbi:MAG: outer membrane protein transport protein [Thiothrix sp.]|uniref:OmpP1/FadL family transporter n=1 Tax=Thiothrix sp. TaxID=1032 RepID=UPI0026035E43|nr:outer membrane protein transport protein [Thiothrix sp.]MDD5392079.1 outer membrane protein transport protein [Thiothrix sp.]
MRYSFNKTLLVTSIVLALGSQAAFATNGLAPTGLGMEHRAMGGAAAGYAANTTSMATNPASASFINDGYDLGLEVFSPNRKVKYKSTGITYSGNGEDMFLVPEGGYKKQINDKVAAGVVVYGNGGMNSTYDTALPYRHPQAGEIGFGTSNTNIDLKQLFVAPTISYKVNDNNAIGVSANIVYQELEANGLQSFDRASASANPGFVTNKGTDSSMGVGATLGWQGKVSPNVTLGVAHRTKVKMGKLDKYKGLIANAGEMDVPAATTIGMAWQATPKTLIAADVQHVYYTDVEAIGNSTDPTLKVGAKTGFGWDDVTAYKIGVKHQVKPDLALMAGYNHGNSPVGPEDTTLNALTPAVSKDHISLGVEKKLSPKSKLIASYVHAFENEVNGDSAHQYDLKMSQDALGIAFSREF